MHVRMPEANNPRAVTNVVGKALGGNSHLAESCADHVEYVGYGAAFCGSATLTM